MHIDEPLIEPTLTIRDLVPDRAVTTTASPEIAKALRDEARESLDDCVLSIGKVGPAANLTWQRIHDLEAYLSDAQVALHIIRATTAAPEED